MAHPWWCLLLGVALYPLAGWGNNISLRHFPWKRLEAPRLPDADLLFSRLGPVNPKPRIPVLIGIFVSALIAWWLFWITFNADFPRDSFAGVMTVGLLGGGALAFGRLINYTNGYSPPISLLGRLLTGRLLIPGYDKVYIAPAITICAGLLVPIPSILPSLPVPLVLAATAFFILLPTLTLGPSLGKWQLTGRHRITKRTPFNSPHNNRLNRDTDRLTFAARKIQIRFD